MSMSMGSLVGGVSRPLLPPTELRVYVALMMPDDWELPLGIGVCTSVGAGGDDGGFSLSRSFVFVDLAGVAVTAGLGFGLLVADGALLSAPSFLPKKDMRDFCFILSALGAIASTSTKLRPTAG